MRENHFASFSTCGAPEQVLEVKSAPVREPEEGELLVRMLAAPINPADINFIQGVYGIKPVLPDSPPGWKAAASWRCPPLPVLSRAIR